MMIFKKLLLTVFASWAVVLYTDAQELSVKVNVNRSQIQSVDASVFEDFKNQVEEFINTKQWTALQFQEHERISCSINITVKEYRREGGTWVCSAMIQANRPVFNSTYNSVLFQFQDNDFTFTFNQYDKLEFNEEMIDNQLTALIAYYSYFIIGINLDSFSTKGGEDILQRCMNLTNNAQNLDYPGWKAFESSKNRFSLINDYLEGAMEPFRLFQYSYYRKGLDEMANNVERGRTEVATAITEQLNAAHKDRPMSLLPQIWTDYKKDELANIFKGKGTQKEKEDVYQVLFSINPSQSASWNKIKE